MSLIARDAEALNEIDEALEEESASRIELGLEGPIDPARLIPTGSTLLNLALSDRPEGGFYLGTVNNIIGDSAAGKTFLLWTVFAECVYDTLKRFEHHRLVYDEPEASLAFDLAKLFGVTVAEMVRISLVSGSVEEFHDNVIAYSKLKDSKTKKGVPFIYGIDSMDSIATEDELDADPRKGDFGGKKPKLIGQILRKIVQSVKKTLSAVFIISQTRDKIGVTFGSKKTRSGGRALKFYSTHELWLAVENHIKRRERDVGVNVVVKVGKNKLTGKLRTVKFPIYYDYGIDDTISCIDFLIEEGFWKKAKASAEEKADKAAKKSARELLGETAEDKEKEKKTRKFATEFGDMTVEALVKYIEDNDKKAELVQITAEAWYEIEDSIKTKRAPKYNNR